MILRSEMRHHSHKLDLAPGTGRASVALRTMKVTVPITLWWAGRAHWDPLPPTREESEVLDLCVESFTVRARGQRPRALHICIGSPKEDFAQICTKFQPWEVR